MKSSTDSLSSNPDLHQAWQDLLALVNKARIFQDSKAFVDCIYKRPLEEILVDFISQGVNPDFSIEKFLTQNFIIPTSLVTPPSFAFSDQIVQRIDELWDHLSSSSSHDEAAHCSLIRLPHKYIVPGGRFTEMYYWDSYFTMLGLKASGRADLIRSMVDNFAYLLEKYGLIPNGTRTYYLSRSQPPFFFLMVELLASIDGPPVLTKYLPHMLIEHSYWMSGRSGIKTDHPSVSKSVVSLDNGALLNRYWDSESTPRPEGYAEDVHGALEYRGKKELFFRNIRTAAASGLDFTGRWCRDRKTLATIEILDLVQPELNSLLAGLERTISNAFLLNGEKNKAKEFEGFFHDRLKALLHYCWNTEEKLFSDYNFVTSTVSEVLSAATVVPLFIFQPDEIPATYTKSIVRAVENHLLQPGGIVMSTLKTGQQWDSPNGWAPYQWMAIQGFKRHGFHVLSQVIQDRWLTLNRNVFDRTGRFMEKYDVCDLTKEAGGGEYPNQDGFGWTNGVFKALLNGITPA